MDMLTALYERMPMLQAREQLRMATAITLGTGALDVKDQRALRRELEDAAGIQRPRLVSPPTPAALDALGIKVAS